MNIFVLYFIFPKFFLWKCFFKIFQIYFSIFFVKIFFSHLFFKIFSPNFFFQTFFFQNFVFQIFSSQFFFQLFCKIFFLRALLSIPPRLQRQNKLYVSVLWKIWFTASGRNWTLVLCDKVLFFGSYFSHHTRPEKFNSFPATHNILLFHSMCENVDFRTRSVRKTAFSHLVI